MRAAHHVAAGRKRAKRGAVVGLAAGDGTGAQGLADFQEVLAGELDCGLVALGAGRAEPCAGQPAGFIVQENISQLFSRAVGKTAGVGVSHRGGLSADRFCNTVVAVSKAGNRGTTGGINDASTIRGMEINAFATAC